MDGHAVEGSCAMPLRFRLVAEFVGTAFLLIGVVGSGIMADSLSPQNAGVALLANAIATGCILYALIVVLGPVSGAHFNPAVTLAMLLRGRIRKSWSILYVAVQLAGGVAGVWTAHLMFELPVLQVGDTARTGPAQWFAEVVAAFGLVSVIFGGLRHAPHSVGPLVALYIAAAYWFTASTSFANPAVTVARSFTDTFAGIDPHHASAFILAQFLGAAMAAGGSAWLFRD